MIVGELSSNGRYCIVFLGLSDVTRGQIKNKGQS